MKYENYFTRKNINGEVERFGEVKRYGEVSYIFKPNTNLLCIKTGERAIAKVLERILIKHFYNIIHIHRLKLSESSIKYDGPNDANKITIFLLHLITEFLSDDSHSILSHTKVGFKNPSAARLKTLVVSGTNLLKDDAVADQVANLATLKNIDMQLSWVYDKRGNNAVLTTFSLYTEGFIKIVIRDDITNEHYAMDIVEYIYQKIVELMNIKIEIKTISVMEHYFADVLSRRKALNSYLLDRIKEKLISDKILSQYHATIERIIEEFKEIS